MSTSGNVGAESHRGAGGAQAAHSHDGKDVIGSKGHALSRNEARNVTSKGGLYYECNR